MLYHFCQKKYYCAFFVEYIENSPNFLYIWHIQSEAAEATGGHFFWKVGGLEKISTL